MNDVIRHNLDLIKECLKKGDYESALAFAEHLDNYLEKEKNEEKEKN